MESAALRAPSGSRKHSAPSSNATPSAKQSRTKRRPAVSQEKPGQTQAFFFVEQGSSTREKRAHVMRHHIQEKRRQSRLANNADKQSARCSRYLPWQKNEGKDDAGASPTTSPPQSTSPVTTGPVGAPSAAVYTPSQPVPVSSPKTMLSASRMDPFRTLPMVDQRGYELADYWTSKLTYWSGPNPHMKTVVFQTAMRHPVSFQAVILAYCARWKARLYNCPEDPEIVFYVGQAKQTVEQALRGAQPMDEESLAMALTGLSLQEERFSNNRKKADEYADRALQLLRLRTGYNVTVSSVTIEVFLLYVRYIMFPRGSSIDADGARWLVSFLRSAEQMMSEHSRPSFLSLVPQRHSFFQIESPLYRFLSSGPHPSQVPNSSRMYVIQNAPTQEICRTAALIYITTTLWDHRESPNKTARYLNQLMAKLEERSLDRYPMCESFVWMLLEENYDADLKDPERAWLTGELLKRHKLLSPELQFYFNEILLSFLMLNRPLKGVDFFEKELHRVIP
ncbi:hypothetical protein VTN00DRAFT_9939 [Thermoascus crustaceus]|uniref:uncharacterized protein n=1 Tax=Thermoascus crustaceus TaxID=5088 RepID=UPI0037440128